MIMQDDEIRAMLVARFPLCFSGDGADKMAHISVDKSMLGGGRLTADWHVDLVEYVEAALERGLTKEQACEQFSLALPSMGYRLLSKDTVRQQYYKLLNGKAHLDFCDAILEGRIDDAIERYKHLSPMIIRIAAYSAV